jgi:hypothetical protein
MRLRCCLRSRCVSQGEGKGKRKGSEGVAVCRRGVACHPGGCVPREVVAGNAREKEGVGAKIVTLDASTSDLPSLPKRRSVQCHLLALTGPSSRALHAITTLPVPLLTALLTGTPAILAHPYLPRFDPRVRLPGPACAGHCLP